MASLASEIPGLGGRGETERCVGETELDAPGEVEEKACCHGREPRSPRSAGGWY